MGLVFEEQKVFTTKRRRHPKKTVPKTDDYKPAYIAVPRIEYEAMKRAVEIYEAELPASPRTGKSAVLGTRS